MVMFHDFQGYVREEERGREREKGEKYSSLEALLVGVASVFLFDDTLSSEINFSYHSPSNPFSFSLLLFLQP